VAFLGKTSTHEMELKSSHLAVVCFLILLCPTIAGAKDVSGMYTPEILEHWKDILEPWVNKIFKEEIEPNLSRKATAVLANTKIEVSTTSQSNDPFEYYSQGRSLKIPVLSLKFFYDLVMAHLWLDAHGFEDPSFQYVCALKYQDSSRFPQGRYSTPFDSMGISHNRLMEATNANDNEDVELAFQQLFNGALLFVLAHEFAHVLQSKEQQITGERQTSLEREVDADIFAFEILQRARFNPAGVMFLFMYSSVWVRNAADFNTTEEYQHWLETADHPLTGMRLKMVGTRLVHDPQPFFPTASDSDPRIAIIKTMGSRLIDMGKDLDNLTSRRELRAIAQDIKVANLAVHKEKHDDLVELSGGWWGLAFESFPEVAGLKYGTYAQGDDPVDRHYRVIMPFSGKIADKWIPKELMPLEFKFTSTNGLVEISGFLPRESTQDGVVTALIQRYGPPDQKAAALNMVTYIWHLKTTVLEVSGWTFRLAPNKPGEATKRP